jgi:hypothetical protein
MEFIEAELDKFLPLYYDLETRERIKSGLAGFYNRKEKPFEYPKFYTNDSPDYLLQSDLLNSVRTVSWSRSHNDFYPIYTSAILISNTCDIVQENERDYNEKQALIAPMLDINLFFKEMFDEGYNQQQIDEMHSVFKNQSISNILYLPPNFINGNEYLVWLDKICWVPPGQLNGGYASIIDNRFLGLTNWAFYLFLFKITFHFARLGRDNDRRSN